MARTKGDDGLIADDVGIWASEKHDYLVRYIDTASATRKKFLPPIGSGGSSYVDLFCGTGRSLVRETNQWIDGSAVAAWKAFLIQQNSSSSTAYLIKHGANV